MKFTLISFVITVPVVSVGALLLIWHLFYQPQKPVFKNWAGNQVCVPENIFVPKDKNELRSIVVEAYHNNRKLRVVGAGHSWSDIVCTQGSLIDMKNINRVLNLDTEQMRITVEAGITVHALNSILAQHNLTLPNQAVIDTQTIGGSVATATHGTGKTGTFSDFVKEVKLLLPDGRFQKLSKDTKPDWFAAAVTSVGSLGVIYAITLQCEALFGIESGYYQVEAANVFEQYQDLLKKYDFMALSWQPYDDTWYVYYGNKISTNQIDMISRVKGTKGYAHTMLTGRDQGRPRVEEEIAIKVEELPRAINALKDIITKYRTMNVRILGTVSIRFVRADKRSYLSPTSERDSVFISISLPPDKDYESFFNEFEAMMLKFNGRPHWGKINFLTYDNAKALYGRNFDKFINIRKLSDPKEVFSNQFTKRVFGA